MPDLGVPGHYKPRAIPADSREVARLGLNSWPDVRYIGGATHPLDTGNHCHVSQSRLPAQPCPTPRKVSPRLAGFRVESDSSGYRGYPTRLVSPRLAGFRVDSDFPRYRCRPTRKVSPRSTGFRRGSAIPVCRSFPTRLVVSPLSWFPLRLRPSRSEWLPSHGGISPLNSLPVRCNSVSLMLPNSAGITPLNWVSQRGFNSYRLYSPGSTSSGGISPLTWVTT